VSEKRKSVGAAVVSCGDLIDDHETSFYLMIY